MFRLPLRKAAIVAGVLLSAALLSFRQQKSVASATTLRTEYLVNPLSLSTLAPRLSWTIDGGTARRVTQIRAADLARLHVPRNKALPFIVLADHKPHAQQLDSNRLLQMFRPPVQQLGFAF